MIWKHKKNILIWSKKIFQNTMQAASSTQLKSSQREVDILKKAI